ncbi:MAG TPA: type IV pilus twitching motility protein PilT [Chromatiales bacterium]|nr:type IV pilus twitching motility protein PilT [Chromatiales bacterium]
MGFDLQELLRETVRRDASDLHLVASEYPRMRRYGLLEVIEEEEIDNEVLTEQLMALTPRAAQREFERYDQADFAYELEGVARFRVNMLRHINGVAAVFRTIPAKAFTLEELGMPEILKSFCRNANGLVLVTGKTGSGKSTTLAAMIDFINSNVKGHIITIEDPIEFVHQRKRCLISQREVGVHTGSFASALRSALREDPDVILVGELRDLETMRLAVTAAEVGILVFGTLHTNSATSTVDRIVNAFPANEQSQVRAMLATSLRAVVSQQLVRKKEGDGRVAAIELMVNTPAVSNLLREGKTEQLETALQGGAAQGMQTMDSALKGLMERGIISPEEAYSHAFNKANFEQYLTPEEKERAEAALGGH